MLVADGDKFYRRPPEAPGKKYDIAELLCLVTTPIDELGIMTKLDKILKILKTQGFTEEKDLVDHINDVFKINPSLFGMSFDVNELVRKWRQKKLDIIRNFLSAR
ncbi:hypothetical protein TI03_03930 [Achromatium sp. WMS1]|nr:hypothetical protein TI03_03930 [Achromatium sp. WMS1]